MAGIGKLKERFAELDQQLQSLLSTKHYQGGSFSGDYVDSQLYTNWRVKARHLLSAACGDTSAHYADFVYRENNTGWSTNLSTLLQLQAVFEAAREDFEGGYLNSVRSLVQAEVFSNELEQANELLLQGYKSAAAVIAGVVLETTLRQLCDDAGLPAGSLNKMNDDLTKAGLYSLLIKKRITALADIRNNAAHGHPTLFTHDDVKDMIAKIEEFVADHVV